MIDSVKGREYREATHEEMPVIPIADRRLTIEQQLIAREEAQASALERRGQIERVERAIDDPDGKFYRLSAKQRRVLELRFGRGMKQKAAGAVMGVSQQATQQLEAAALVNLRKKLAA